jgi:hypothetical protein
MKSLVIAAALVAFVSANMGDRFNTNREEMREKWNAMSEDERQEIRNQHIQRQQHQSPRNFRQIPEDARQKMHEKFESMTPEEREEFKGKMKARFEKLPEEQKQKFQAIHDKLKALPEEERKQEIQKLRNEHLEKMPHRPSFADMPEEIRQKMRNRFESLSPEERQTLFERLHRQRFPDSARAALAPISEEEKQDIRSKFASLTSEQREEIRSQINARPRPLPIGPRPAPVVDGFQPIRRPTDDIMVSRQQWIHDFALNKKDE